MGKPDLKRNAQAFAIWRAAKSADWDCSYAELAAETGVPHHRVGQIVRARGWDKRFAHNHHANNGRREGFTSVDSFMTGYSRNGFAVAVSH